MPSQEQDKALVDFLARHVTPYDPAIDDYVRPPFAADVVSPGRSDFYNFHYYLTKVPPESIIGLIRHYSAPGDLILDLFCGSGMTGVAVQMVNQEEQGEQRYCILNDLSPAACHIAESYTSPAEAQFLADQFAKLAPTLAQVEQSLYTTHHFEPASGIFNKNSDEVQRALGSPNGSGLFRDAPEAIRHEGQWQLVTEKEVADYLGFSPNNLAQSAPSGEWLKVPARLVYVAWSDIYKCEGFKTIEVATGKINARTGKPTTKKARVVRGCGNEIIARGTDDKTEEDGNNAFIRCPHCQERWMKGRVPRLRVAPVEECYEYLGLVSSKNGAIPKLLRAKRPVSRTQMEFIAKLRQQEIPYRFPDHPLNKAHPRYRRDSLAGKKIETYRDFFTYRNMWGLAAIWSTIANADPHVQKALRFCFTSHIMRSSRLRRMKGDKPGDQLSGTLHIASETAETNVFVLFRKAVSDYCKTVATTNLRDKIKPIVRTGSATDLSELPDGCIDYIFTDPPFGSNIYYSGVTFMWEAWLDRFTDEPMEAVMHREVDGGYKRLADYGGLMRKAFNEMFRVLKPGRHATVEFNNSDGAVFQVIRDGLTSAGFEIDNMLLFDKVARTFAQIRSNAGISEVVDKDVLFNVHKPAVVRVEVRAAEHDLEQQLAEAVRQHLQTLPERIRTDPAKYSDEHRTTATINSMLMNSLIPRGVSVERLNLPFIESVCSHYFRKVGQHWYLRGEAVGGSVAGLVQEEVAIKDEVSAIDWLRQKLQVRPMLVGELKPYWQKATGLLPAAVSQTLALDNLLTENFWRDVDTNRWREPTAEERERMNDDRSLRALHDAQRFVAGTLERPSTDDERCLWIDVLFRACRAVEDKEMDALPALRDFDKAEAYSLITRLFQSVLKEHVPADVFRRVEKQYRAASSRIASQVEKEKEAEEKSGKKDNKQATMDLGI